MKKIILICFLLLLSGCSDKNETDSSIGVAVRDNSSLSREELEQEQELYRFINENTELFEDLNKKMLAGKTDLEDAEINLRKKLYEFEGKSYSEEQILEILSSEKDLLTEALKKNLIDEDEIDSIVNEIVSRKTQVNPNSEVFYEYEKYNFINAYVAIKLKI